MGNVAMGPKYIPNKRIKIIYKVNLKIGLFLNKLYI